ncbi:hypothetical protein [Microcystis sp. LE19-59.1C]|uniref:hypothetical protein n=1 Tax=Microcystis sp. LE19-59.1C TaxID=3016442 RepID=UPI00258A26E9|nr:hypothetical protein [Microcystis sp. LE19-59.1C]
MIGSRSSVVRRLFLFILPTPHTPHPTPYTPHPTPYTPHPTPHTPHPTPHTPSLITENNESRIYC